MKRLLIVLITVLTASIVAAPALANKKSTKSKSRTPAGSYLPHKSSSQTDRSVLPRGPLTTAAANSTTYLAYYTFDAGAATCDAQGWTSHDITAQKGDYFHVDDFAACAPGTFGRLYAIEGDQSLWCGACPSTTDEILCHYAALPGYGNDWDQAFCTKECVFVDSMATLDYLIMWDSEPGYDYIHVEYILCDDPWWSWGAHRVRTYDDIGGPVFVSDAIPVEMESIRVRFHFSSDNAWSDGDGIYDTDGAVIIDSLTLRCAGAGIVIPTETFEDETVGDTDADNWESCPLPGYGDLAQLIRAVPTTYQNNPVQEDPCADNFTCLWNFVNGSTANYACNTPDPSPQQLAVPFVNARNQYIDNEIWSPWIPFTGTGSTVNLEFDVYRDLVLDNMIFYVWHVRTKDSNSGNCPSAWDDRGYFYYGSDKDWYRALFSIGGLIPPGTTHIQIALGPEDMCPYWCGLWFQWCHSHAPMFDNVAVYRVQTSGPQFSVSDIDMFQDNFSADGTITGPARADMAQDLLSSWYARIIPGDSVCITLGDPEVGLGGDSYTGCGPAAYCYLSVDGHPGGLTAAQIQAPETRGTCGPRWPHAATTGAAGRTWYVYRMDSCFAANGNLAPNRYCVDFNDNLFTPGDTCWFFFGGHNSTGTWNYYSLPYGQSASLDAVAATPDEFTILPAAGDEPGNDILYVDGMNFRGAQPFFDTAFQNMNILDKIDRYDIRGPSSGDGNRPGSRVVNVSNQLIGIYNKIIWDTGDMKLGNIGDGVGYEKSDDASMLFNWLDQMPNTGGIYFCGDNLADELPTLTGPGAVSLRSYVTYSVTKNDHVDYGLGFSPVVKGSVGGIFSHGGTGDSLIAYGGCPLINDFDVISPTGAAVLEASYYGGGTSGGAIVSQTTTNSAGYPVTVILSGYSFHTIRDIDNNGISDRMHHLHDILAALNNVVDDPIAVRPNPRRNSLAQNYPNPFNPTTTIRYSIRERGHVSLRVYNVAGQLVRVLVDEVLSPESVRPVEWDGLNQVGGKVSSGVYFYKLSTKGFTKTRKMVLLK